MAFSLTLRCWCFAIKLIAIATSHCYADEDPVQIVTKVLLCFNNKMIYASCQESYGLNESGNLDVPPEATDEYCNGPCYDKTELALNCVDGVLSNFLFYNTVERDVRSTIYAACSDASEKGNFNVASHMQGEYSHAHKHVHQIYMYMAMVVVGGLLLSQGFREYYYVISSPEISANTMTMY